MNDKENNAVQTRREFMSETSKKALIGTAAVFLGFGMLKPEYAKGDCSGCRSCTGGCEGACSGCEGCTMCSGSCEGCCTACMGETAH